jgi:hypothetical protein
VHAILVSFFKLVEVYSYVFDASETLIVKMQQKKKKMRNVQLRVRLKFGQNAKRVRLKFGQNAHVHAICVRPKIEMCKCEA